jgi:excisionase family DNA binding protein
MAQVREGRLTCTVEEAAVLLGISRGQAYHCVRTGELRSVQLGRRIVIPRIAIDELLSGSPAAPTDDSDLSA